jgi:hypothetical protein
MAGGVVQVVGLWFINVKPRVQNPDPLPENNNNKKKQNQNNLQFKQTKLPTKAPEESLKLMASEHY